MRDKQIIMRVTEAEKNTLKTAAKFADMTLSEFIRFQTIGVTPRRTVIKDTDEESE